MEEENRKLKLENERLKRAWKDLMEYREQKLWRAQHNDVQRLMSAIDLAFKPIEDLVTFIGDKTDNWASYKKLTK